MSPSGFDGYESDSEVLKDIRRELANASVEFVGTRQGLEDANDKLAEVQRELSAFRHVMHKDLGVAICWALIVIAVLLAAILWRVW